MTFDDRVRALQPLGFTPRQTRFLVTVALHSGYCLRRQYAAFAGVGYGKNVCAFLETLVARQLAERFMRRADRGLIYHLHARAIYRALGQSENRNRRTASAALIARKIMTLDYVLAHPEHDWLATEADKVARFTERYGVPLAELPHQVFTAARPGVADTTRYFIDRLPVAVTGEPSVARFVCLVTEATGRSLERFLADHARLFAWIPAWTVVAISPSAVALAACEGVLARHRQAPSPAVATGAEDLRWFFATRQTVDRGDLSRLSVADIDRFRTLRTQFTTVTFDGLYADWRQRGEPALAAYTPLGGRPAVRSIGQLVTERLPFDYRQFGSLPGVA